MPSINIIHIEIIPHSQQRYNTCGDYFFDSNSVLQIRVSDMGQREAEMAVLIHELVELSLCLTRNIEFSEIDGFDQLFELERKLGRHTEDEEPGDHPDAPYRHEHRFAENIERQFVHESGLDWGTYDQKVRGLA